MHGTATGDGNAPDLSRYPLNRRIGGAFSKVGECRVMPPLWGRLGELAIPVVLVAGERDAKFRAIAERMAAALPDARVEVVGGAGHAVQLERPEAVAALV